jgi:hypothetical protein
MACPITTFLTGAMSVDIETAINHVNELAVKLRDQVGPPRVAIDVSDICMQQNGSPDPDIQTSDATECAEFLDFAQSGSTRHTSAGQRDSVCEVPKARGAT